MGKTTIGLILIIKKHASEKEYREAITDSAQRIIEDFTPEEREVIYDKSGWPAAWQTK